MPETMTPTVDAGASVGTSTPNIGSTPDTGSTGGSTDSGAGTGSSTSSTPEKFSIDLGDGKPFDIDFEDELEAGGDDDAAEFKFRDLDAIKESHADLHKSLMRRLSEHSRFSSKFKSPEELDSHLERVERLSGGRGLDALESTVNKMATELRSIRSGDPGDWAKESPEEFSAAAQKFSDAWFQADPKASVAYLAKAAVSALIGKDSYGQSALDAFNAAYDATTEPQTKKLLERVAHTFDAIVQNSKYEPDSTLLKSRQLETRETQVFKRESDGYTTPKINAALREAFKQAGKKLGVDFKPTADEQKSYMADMLKGWEAAAGKNPRFMKALNAAYASKNHDEINALVDEYRAEFAADAAKSLYRTRLSKLKANIRKEAGNKSEPGSGAGTTTTAIKWTGGVDPRPMLREMQENPADAKPDDLGQARRVLVTRNSTRIVGGAGDPKNVKARVEEIYGLLKSDPPQIERERLQERLGKLTGGVTVLRLGAQTGLELGDKKMRVDDAVCAINCAIQEGVVPGAGTSLLRIGAVAGSEDSVPQNPFASVLELPFCKILENAGHDPLPIRNRVLTLCQWDGFNVLTGEYGDLREAGVLDPLKVVRQSLLNAASVARQMLLTDTVVSLVR